jgi:hypothetical protein
MKKTLVLSRKNNGIILPAHISELEAEKIKILDRSSRTGVIVEAEEKKIKSFMKASGKWEANHIVDNIPPKPVVRIKKK